MKEKHGGMGEGRVALVMCCTGFRLAEQRAPVIMKPTEALFPESVLICKNLFCVAWLAELPEDIMILTIDFVLDKSTRSSRTAELSCSVFLQGSLRLL